MIIVNVIICAAAIIGGYENGKIKTFTTWEVPDNCSIERVRNNEIEVLICYINNNRSLKVKVKDLIEQLQELSDKEKEMPVTIRMYDKASAGYYNVELSDLYGELLATTTHPLYDYYEPDLEHLTDEVDLVEGIVLE